tara:strand:- start:38653 stop:41718 length:3066 start_codon:yes stop_codon:yes gene_type:complete
MKRLVGVRKSVVRLGTVECLSDKVVADFVKAKLPAQQLEPIDEHLDSCDECRMLVAALAGTLSEEEGDAEPPVAAPTLGRYVVLDIVGQGAMGIVYQAYDPKLDRKVAIKLLHRDRGSGKPRLGPSRDDRFLREAKAMARLVHPNVVAVHDTGVADDQVFVAMEFVDGLNLRQWLAGTPKRGTDEITDAFMQAGAGLAAAHDAGIVHRDFKPDNVFVSKDGAVKVGDFGLVTFGSIDEKNSDGDGGQRFARGSSESPIGESGDASTTLTQTGTRLGTALYMSPEQFDAEPVGPASDQFSFCVAFYEALYGVSPFAGHTGKEIRDAIEAERISEPKDIREVPKQVHRAIVSGLARIPSARHGSMHELLAALEPDVSRANSRWYLGAAVAALCGALALVVFAPWRGAAALCSAPNEELEGVWDDAKRTRLQQAFASNPNPNALEAFERVSLAFDGYSEDWLATRVQTCEATRIDGHQSANLMDLRVHCLQRRLAGFNTQTELFLEQASRPEFASVAASAAHNLPGIAECSDTDALLRIEERPTDPKTAGTLARLEATLDRAAALENVGQPADALAVAEGALVESRALGYAPLYMSALYEAAYLNYELANFDESEAFVAQLVKVASTAGDDHRVADAWLLRENIAVKTSDYDEAIRLEPWVDAAILRAGEQPVHRAKLLAARATVHLRQGKYPEAESDYRKVLTLLKGDSGSVSRIAQIHLNLGIVAFSQGKHASAIEELSQSLALQEKLVGANHPDIARVLLNTCSAYQASAHYEEAEAACSRSLRIREQALGPTHPDLAGPLTVLAHLARLKNDVPSARSRYERALAIQEAALEPMHPDLGQVLSNFGDFLREVGEYETAGDYLRRGLAIKEVKLGGKHPYVGIALHNLGNLAFDTEDYPLAMDYQERALSIFEEALGGEHQYVGFALNAIGKTQLKTGKAQLAIAPLRRALAIREAPDSDPTGLGQTEFLLAKALFASGPQAPTEALALATRAKKRFAAVGESANEDLETVNGWLAKNAKP